MWFSQGKLYELVRGLMMPTCLLGLNNNLSKLSIRITSCKSADKSVLSVLSHCDFPTVIFSFVRYPDGKFHQTADTPSLL